MDKIVEEIRAKVPALNQSVYGNPLVYFDNAATAHKPAGVIDMINRMNSGINANIHRAVHKISSEATALYESGRDAVREFINAPSREEIILTSGTTASINLCAFSFSEAFVKPGDAILVSGGEHHSNLVPWQMACLRKGAELRVLPLDDNGEWRMDLLPGLLQDGKVRIVAANHISNVLGIVNPVRELVRIAHERNVPVLVDGAQGIVHEVVDVQDLDCDFYAFSGHKLYAATGTGVLYGKRKYLDQMPPYMGGGDMVGTVSFEKTTYAELPLKYEAGTPNFIGVATWAPAIAFAKELRAKEIVDNQWNMSRYLEKELRAIEGLQIIGTPADPHNKIPLFSFSIEGVHHEDLALILDKMGIAVRSGLMCAEPLITRFGKTGLLRASVAPYNTMEECEMFVRSLHRAVKMLK